MFLLRKSLTSFAVKKFYYFKSCSPKLNNMSLSRFYCSSGALSTPTADGCEKVYSEKITHIVDQISKLTLIEAADLNECLQKTFKIKDIPMGMGAMAMAAPAAVEDEAAEVTKSSFTVKLVNFDPPKKVSVIKEIKAIIEGLNLVQAKKFVESVPQIVKGDIGKDDAEKLKQQLEAAGGICEID